MYINRLTLARVLTHVISYVPANTQRQPIACLLLGQRRRRQTNIKPSLCHRVVFAWMSSLKKDLKTGGLI